MKAALSTFWYGKILSVIIIIKRKWNCIGVIKNGRYTYFISFNVSSFHPVVGSVSYAVTYSFSTVRRGFSIAKMHKTLIDWISFWISFSSFENTELVTYGRHFRIKTFQIHNTCFHDIPTPTRSLVNAYLDCAITECLENYLFY